MTGNSFAGALSGRRDEQRPLVVSSWPLYLAEGKIATVIDSKTRRISSYMPLTATTRQNSLILGGPNDEPELDNLSRDPHERRNVWRDLGS